MTTLEQFKQAWYAAHVSHSPNYARDRAQHRRNRGMASWRGSVLTAKTWEQAVDRSKGIWQQAAVNRCLPSEL